MNAQSEAEYMRAHGDALEAAIGQAVSATIAARAGDPLRFLSEQLARSATSVVNASRTLRCDVNTATFDAVLHGSGGSSCSTREARVAKGWPDVGPPENIISLAPDSQPRAWEATVSLLARDHGEQAGLYAYVDETTWVKWVAEGAGNGKTQLILASQCSGEPSIDGKLLLDSFGGTISLRVEVSGQTATASYREPEQPGWTPMPRGTGGWLAADDPRGRDRAISPLSPGWRAMLVTEQWAPDKPPAEVRFTEVRVLFDGKKDLKDYKGVWMILEYNHTGDDYTGTWDGWRLFVGQFQAGADGWPSAHYQLYNALPHPVQVKRPDGSDLPEPITRHAKTVCAGSVIDGKLRFNSAFNNADMERSIHSSQGWGHDAGRLEIGEKARLKAREIGDVTCAAKIGGINVAGWIQKNWHNKFAVE